MARSRHMTARDPPDDAESVEAVLGEIDELAAAQRKVCIGDVLDDFGERSFGVVLLVAPLIELSPVGGIWGVPTFLALVIAIAAAQLLLGKDHVWMPQLIQRRGISGKRLHRAVLKLRGVAHWLDAHSRGRLERLTRGAWPRLAGAIVIVLCCTVPPLELIPFASSAPMLAIAAFGVALTVRDGAMMLAALAMSAMALAITAYLVATLLGG
jgi:hypothetical protein